VVFPGGVMVAGRLNNDTAGGGGAPGLAETMPLKRSPTTSTIDDNMSGLQVLGGIVKAEVIK